MLKFFKCKCKKKNDDTLIQSILKNNEIPLEFKLFKLLMRDANLLKQFISKKESELGLSHAQIGVLWILRMNADPLTQADLSKKLDSSKANMSTLLNRMENQELIERITSNKNKKNKNIQITKIGKEKIENLFPKMLPIVKKIFKGIEKEEMENLLKTLDKIRGNLNETI